MKILVCGGDERFVLLSELLQKSGHEVKCYALSRAQLPAGCVRADAPVSADAVILPVPAEDARGMLNAPFEQSPCRIEGILERAGDAVIIGGKLSARLRKAAEERGRRVFDYMQSPALVAENASITAEGAISQLMGRTRAALCDMRVLVIGWGRIGKLLMRKLGALCPSVYLMSANPASRALAGALGHRAIAPNCDTQLLKSFDAVINTAPAPVISDLCALREGCILLELASAPGGVDMEKAAEAGLEGIASRGLPGRYAPESAAAAIFRAVEDILKEVSEHE